MIHKIRIIKTFLKKIEFSIGINIANKLEKFIYSLVFLIDATNTVRNKVKKKPNDYLITSDRISIMLVNHITNPFLMDPSLNSCAVA